MVCSSEVDLGENLCCRKLLEESCNWRDRISLFASAGIELPIIDAKLKCTVLFLGEDDRSADRRFGRSDEAFGEKLVNVKLECLGFGFGC